VLSFRKAGSNCQPVDQLSEPTIYAWRKHFGELAPADVKRLRTLEAENSRLRRLLAERDLDISVLKEINAKEW
jgi:putative transposase